MSVVLFFLISMAIGIVVLMLSMHLTSSAMGGVEFGALGAVIAKSALLLLLVDVATYLLPMPWDLVVTILLWWGGLMLLYGLDFWEARTLVFINFILTTLVNLGLILLFFPPKPPSSL